MKDLIRMSSAISQEMLSLLNEQVEIEAQSSANYLAMASWCNAKGYDNSADFLIEQSDEERKHMLKLFQFVNDMGGFAHSPIINKVNHEFDSLRDVFESVLESEIKVSNAINKIVEKARSDKDYRTENFMQWFVEEQIEEEFVARRAVELFELLGEDKLALFMIDERIPKIKYNKSSPDSGV